MLAMPGLRSFSLAAKSASEGVSCDSYGVFAGGVPLLQPPCIGNPYRRVRPITELNKELAVRYRLRIDIVSKAGALALIAAALNRYDFAMAAIAAVQMQIPDPPLLTNGPESSNEIRRRAAELVRGGLLKFWDPAQHPRAGVPPNPGWFAPAADGSDTATVEPVAMPWPPWEKPEIVEGGGGGGVPRGQLEFPSIRWPWSRAPSPATSGAAPKPSPPGDAQPDLPFPDGLPEQRAPAADADLSEEDRPARGGRLGNAATRAQNAELAAELKDQGYTITGGGGEEDEEFIRGEGPGIKGGTFVDITAVDQTTGKMVRVQTVDTLADGVTPTPREQAAIARIREKYPDDELWIIPKSKAP